MRASMVGIPAFRAIRRHLGRASGGSIPPVHLFGCKPCEIDIFFHVKRVIRLSFFEVDASDSGTTHVIRVDDSDVEVTKGTAHHYFVRKLFLDGVRRPSAGLQRDDFHAVFRSPHFKGGASSARQHQYSPYSEIGRSWRNMPTCRPFYAGDITSQSSMLGRAPGTGCRQARPPGSPTWCAPVGWAIGAASRPDAQGPRCGSGGASA